MKDEWKFLWETNPDEWSGAPAAFPGSEVTAVQSYTEHRRQVDNQVITPFNRRYTRSGRSVIEIGAGAVTAYEFDPEAFTVAVDVDHGALARNNVHSACVVASADALPFRDGTIELVCSRDCIEHLERPDKAFGEFERVLRPGGRVVFQFPNLWHYNSIFSWLAPQRLQDWLWRRLKGRDEMPYPTFYRANTVRKLRTIFRRRGLQLDEVVRFEHPFHWFAGSPILYRLAYLYKRMVDLPRLRRFRSTLLIAGSKRT